MVCNLSHLLLPENDIIQTRTKNTRKSTRNPHAILHCHYITISHNRIYILIRLLTDHIPLSNYPIQILSAHKPNHFGTLAHTVPKFHKQTAQFIRYPEDAHNDIEWCQGKEENQISTTIQVTSFCEIFLLVTPIVLAGTALGIHIMNIRRNPTQSLGPLAKRKAKKLSSCIDFFCSSFILICSITK